jgi:hypothetical protein
MILTVVGPLKGLAYIILLPLVGISAIFVLVIRKPAALRQRLSKSLVTPRDNDKPHQASL